MNARKILQTFEMIAHEVAVGEAHVAEPTPETRREARLLLDYARNRLAEIRCHPTGSDASNDPELVKPARREVTRAPPVEAVATLRSGGTAKHSN
jgi:hypothetical protein